MHVSAAFNIARGALHRWRCLPSFLFVQPVLTCQASTSSTSSRHPFPFPSRTNPTPYEIFHLPRSASQGEIKMRYYELVKVYHPDATHGKQDVSPSVRNAQFRAITHAYGILRGRNILGSNGGTDTRDYRDEAIRAELRCRSRRSSSTSTATAAGSIPSKNTGDALVWYTLAGFMLVGIIAAIGSVSSHMDRVERHTQSAAANLAQARAEAQIYGMERRRKIRERVRSFRDAGELVDGSGHLETSKMWQGGPLRGEMPENMLKDKRT